MGSSQIDLNLLIDRERSMTAPDSQAYGSFITTIICNLEKNGFPEKQVALPMEKLWESAHNKGLNLNKVLEFLKEKKDIDHKKDGERIVFFKKVEISDNIQNSTETQDVVKDMPNMGNIFNEMGNLGDMKNMNMKDMFAQASAMMKNLNPQQLDAIKSMYENMDEDQKNEMMKKAKDMGMF
ncbi:MAG: hypothetical protein CMP10_13305 [Zetaproteobacteria bacterium]|nr:hypothetical protein [Pseudobdellovibrionaceae bacterium]